MKRHLLAVSIIIVILSISLAYLFSKISLLPEPSSTEMGIVDGLVRMLFIVASFFFAYVFVILAYSLVFFRRRRGDNKDGPPMKGSTRLEAVWIIIPLLVVTGFSIYGGLKLSEMTSTSPEPSLRVNVTAQRFSWSFNYPDYSINTFELGLPVNEVILFNIESLDVVHSFWIREFGPKMDAVPGMTTQLRLTPNKTGDYFVECAELCGDGHTYMIAPARVMTESDFEDWIQIQRQNQPGQSPSPTPAAQ